jgi:hypothetical protein
MSALTSDTSNALGIVVKDGAAELAVSSTDARSGMLNHKLLEGISIQGDGIPTFGSNILTPHLVRTGWHDVLYVMGKSEKGCEMRASSSASKGNSMCTRNTMSTIGCRDYNIQ